MANEPGIPRGVTRERTDLYVRDRAIWELQEHIISQKTREDGICSFLAGGRRSYTTLKIEGILDNKSPRDVAKAIRQFRPINFLQLGRSENGGFPGLGYVNFQFAVHAELAIRDFEMVRGSGTKICFARPCRESMDILRMNQDDMSSYQVTLTGDDRTIFNEGNELWGLANFGKTGDRHERRDM